MIDCHCHFDMMSSPEQYIAQMGQNGNTIIGKTNRPCHFRQGLPFIKKNSKILYDREMQMEKEELSEERAARDFLLHYFV